MKKGQKYEGIVTNIDFPNKGIVEIEGEKCIVKNALPGQTISFCVTKKRKGRSEGRLLEIIKRADTEKAEYCQHFGECGGCLYQSLPYLEQLRIKEDQVKRILEPVLKKQERNLAEVWEPAKESPEREEYRNKMEFSFGNASKDAALELGMHKRGSFHDIVTVTDCHLVDGDFRSILNTVLEYFKKTETSFYHKLTHIGYLRHLLVRKAKRTGEILVALVTTTQETMNNEALVKSLLALKLKGSIVGILHIENDSLADVVQSDKTNLLYGQDFFYEEILGLQFRISPFSFFQTNTLGAEVLYQTAREFIGELNCDLIYDLYSGTGTIAQMMAPAAKKVVGVEIVEEAVVAARENAANNGLTNCEFIAGDVLKVLDNLEMKPDLIVLDPPRDGIHPKALPKIISYGVDKILYISCKPTSLARDLEVFLESGYTVERICCIDMFAWSGNVESIILMQKCGSAKKIQD